ncbi:hypothetical protein V1509DRAFT_621606 [Lipomyces kononenkoae]
MVRLLGWSARWATIIWAAVAISGIIRSRQIYSKWHITDDGANGGYGRIRRISASDSGTQPYHSKATNLPHLRRWRTRFFAITAEQLDVRSSKWSYDLRNIRESGPNAAVWTEVMRFQQMTTKI